MKKVTAVIATQSRKNTYRAVQEFEKGLRRLGELDFEYVFLSDYRLEFCRGCKVCFDRGEELCPLKDDRDLLIEKLERSDGVVFATPNYAFHVPARMKNLFDRTAFIFHRPRFFGKVCAAVVTQGMFGGGTIVKYCAVWVRTSASVQRRDAVSTHSSPRQRGRRRRESARSAEPPPGSTRN